MHAIDRRRRQRAAQLDLNSRKRLLEYRENRRQHVGGVEIRSAQHHVTLDLGRGEPRQQFIMQSQNRFRVGQHHVAIGRELHSAAFVMEQDFADNILKALNLQTDRRLRAPEPARRLGDAAGIDHRYQRTQRPDIEAEKVHRLLFCLRLAQCLDPAAMQTSCKHDMYRAQSLGTSLPPYAG